MTPNPLHQLLDTAQKSGLISGAQRLQITREFGGEQPSTMQDAASLLVTHHVLTANQAQRLLAGLQEKSILAGRYQILEKLGEGGMGAVFKAHDRKLDRIVAIKVMAAHQVQHPDAVARFHREAKALAKVAHPAIVQAFDADQEGDQHFLVMEYIDGVNVSQLLQEKGTLSPTRAADYVYQAALGIQHAHERGLIHRDLKPGNLLVTPDRQIKILDLGLARFAQDLIPDAQVTREGTGLGTPDYMAPEQFSDARNVDARADIYALGCTLYHLVSGRVPFPGSSLAEKATAHESKSAPPLAELCPDAPAGLALAIGKMMAKRPSDRFQTAREAAEALAPYVASSSASMQKIVATTSWEGSQLSFTVAKARRKRAVGGAILACGFAALAIVAALLAWPWLFPGEPGTAPLANTDKTSSDAKPEVKIAKNDPKKIDKVKPDDQKKIEKKKETTPPPPKIVTIPNGLTVAKDGTGQFTTINEALAKVEPGMTIRVLDDATYPEAIHLNRAATQAGVIIETTGGATLEFPAGKVGFMVQSVPKVTLRGFRVTHADKIDFMLGAVGNCQGLHLDRLAIKITNTGPAALTLEGLEPSGAPIVVEHCRFEGGRVGIRVSGFLDYKTPSPCGNIALRNNTILDSSQGILIMGTIKNLQAVGNRVAFCLLSGIQLENLLPGTNQIAIANNTVLGCRAAFRVWDDGRKEAIGKNITVMNNVFLKSNGPDAVFLDSGGAGTNVRGPGDGKALLQQWTWRNNWREGMRPFGTDVFTKSWIPLADDDSQEGDIEVASRNPQHEDFLGLPKASPLATAGKGEHLPTWVGAVPPAGAEPWNWQWTWDALIHNRLTVAKNGAGRFKTINQALDKVRPGQTIRVLDKEVYAEPLSLTSPSSQDGITLESPLGAILSADQDGSSAIMIKAVRGLTVRGFRLRSDAARLSMVYVKESAPGLLLDRLTFEPGSAGDYDGVFLFNLTAAAADPPVVVQNCVFRKPQMGVGIQGKDFLGTYQLCRGIAVRDNLILEPTLFGVLLKGHLEKIQIVGNRIGKCARLGAIQFEDLAPTTADLLLANNSVCDAPHAFRLWDSRVKGTNVRICNNLFLAAANPDMVFFDSGGDAIKIKGPGDGRLLAKHWKLSHNWRETRAPVGSGLLEKSWVPPSPSDVLKDRIEVLSRLPSDADYLKPRAASPLAKAGAGGDLPAYVGALPPDGTNAWDWNKTWQRWKSSP